MAKKKVNEPKYILSPINTQMLNYRVYYMSSVEKIAYSALLFLLGGFAGYVFYGGLFKAEGEATLATVISNIIVFVLVGAIAVVVFLPMLREWRREKRDKVLQLQFKDMLESLAASLSSGNTVTEAFANALADMQNQYLETDYIIVELKEILSGIKNGLTLEEMLASFSSRTSNEDIDNFSNVINNCFRLGSDFKTAVRTTRDIIGDKNAIEDEIDTKLASNKLQLNAMCIMPLVLVGLLKMTNPLIAANLSTFVGILATTFALALFVGAYFWGRKIIDIR